MLGHHDAFGQWTAKVCAGPTRRDGAHRLQHIGPTVSRDVGVEAALQASAKCVHSNRWQAKGRVQSEDAHDGHAVVELLLHQPRSQTGACGLAEETNRHQVRIDHADPRAGGAKRPGVVGEEDPTHRLLRRRPPGRYQEDVDAMHEFRVS